MNRTASPVAHALAWGLAATSGTSSGCHEPFSNDDLLFLLAAPQDLEIEVPTENTTGPGPGVAQTDEEIRARFARDAARTADAINAGVLSVLEVIGLIVARPPTVRERNRRMWGPFPLSVRTELLLIVDRIPTATVARFVSTKSSTAPQFFNYALLGRPLGGADNEWAGLILGSSHPRTHTPGAGRFFVDFESGRMLEPSAEERGAFLVGYDVTPEDVVIELVADGDFADMFEPDAVYQHTNRVGGEGTFLFFERENLVETTDQEEVLAVGARWLASGRGRADVIVAEGDLLLPLVASECWDERFVRVFMFSTVPGPDFAQLGAVEDCGPELLDAQFPE